MVARPGHVSSGLGIPNDGSLQAVRDLGRRAQEAVVEEPAPEVEEAPAAGEAASE